MGSRLVTALLASVALGALGLAACGSGAEDEYKDDFPLLSREIVSLGQEVGDSIQTAAESTDRELAEDFDRFARELGDIRSELDELEPPDELADEQDELEAAMRDVQGPLQDIADAAEASDPEAARLATEELVQRSADLREARRELARAVDEL
ncbi:MAG: hypothetical protein ACRDL0_01110 [Thermoleophilaceae bacterium]